MWHRSYQPTCTIFFLTMSFRASASANGKFGGYIRDKVTVHVQACTHSFQKTTNGHANLGRHQSFIPCVPPSLSSFFIQGWQKGPGSIGQPNQYVQSVHSNHLINPFIPSIPSTRLCQPARPTRLGCPSRPFRPPQLDSPAWPSQPSNQTVHPNHTNYPFRVCNHLCFGTWESNSGNKTKAQENSRKGGLNSVLKLDSQANI